MNVSGLPLFENKPQQVKAPNLLDFVRGQLPDPNAALLSAVKNGASDSTSDVSEKRAVRPTKRQGKQAKPRTDLKRAERFRGFVETIERRVDSLLNSGTSQQRPTRRRLNIIEGQQAEARELKKVAALLSYLADRWEAGDCPGLLQGIKQKKQAEMVCLYCERFLKSDNPHQADGLPGYKSEGNWAKMGVTEDNWEEFAALVRQVVTGAAPDPVEVEIANLEREAILSKIPGFFWTPEELIERMVWEADLNVDRGLRILEPSAGKGDIADYVRERWPKHTIYCCETQWSLRKILELKGYSLMAHDFLEFDVPVRYDRILMNPPFEQLQYIDHICHAYELLESGGILVAIAARNWQFRSDQKCQDFRRFVEEHGWSVDVERGMFKMAGTDVATTMIVLGK